MNPKLDAALDAARRGFRVFPIGRDSRIPWDKGWQTAATTDEAAVAEWWTENRNYNIGIATGQGLLVIDVDVKDGKRGAESLEMLEMLGLPPTLKTRTPSGGIHLYFDIGDKDHAGRVNNIPDFPGIDTRCKGNLTLWPGSNIGRHKYEIVDDLPIATCPDWLFDIIETKVQSVARVEVSDIEPDQPEHIDRAKLWLETQAPQAVEGNGGDNTTFSVAAELRALGVSEHTALNLMLEHWNEEKASPPWLPDELAVKVKNAFQHGQGALGGKTAAGEMDVVEIEPPSPELAERIRAHVERMKGNFEVGIPTSDKKPTKLHFLSYAEMKEMPEPEWLVENIVQKRSGALIFGKSNTFKSFLGIDIGLSIATGRDWHGNAVNKGRVLFVATEGANGVGRLRIPGWFDHYGIDEADRANVMLFPKEICLDVKADVDALISTSKELGGFDLIVLDIFGGTMNGTEVEDTTARAWVRSVQRIIREVGSAVLTIAHTGWQDETRARMHTHFWGSFDSRMRVEGDKEKLTTCLTIERHKDADSSGSWGFQLEPSAGTLVPILDDTVKPNKAAGLSGALQRAVNALDEAIEAEGVLKFGEQWPSCRVVPLSTWRAHCDRLNLSSSEDGSARRKAFNRARDALQLKKAIDVFDGFVWSTFDA